MTIEPGDEATGGGVPAEAVPPAGPPAPTSVSTSSSAEVLQSMLSRAAEGQVNEQRELTGAITDMRNQLMRVSQELAELRVRPVEETSDATANNLTVEIRESVRFLSERLDGVARMVAQRGEELADIRIALTAIDAHVRSQAETIGVLSAGLQALPSYGERVSALHVSIQQIQQQLAGVAQSVAAPNADPALAERLTAIEAALAPVSGHAEQLSQLQSSSSRLQQSVTGMVQSLSGVQESVAGGTAPDTGELDERIGTSVTGAMRESEQRLMAHVDEAVMALAHTLLRRKSPAASPPEAPDEPAAEAVDEPVTEAVEDTSAEPDVPAMAAAENAAVEESVEPDLETAPDEQPEEATASDAPDLVPQEADEADETDDVDVPAEPVEALDDADVAAEIDQPTAEHWGSFAHELLDAAPANFVKSAPAELSWNEPSDSTDESGRYDLDAANAATESQLGYETFTGAPNADSSSDGPTGWPATDGEDDEGSEASADLDALPPPDAETMLPPTTEAWTPQTPPARDPADPTLEVGEEPKKRRWGRNK